MAIINEKIVEKIKHYCAYQERCHSEVRYKLVDLGARGDELEEIIVLLMEENYLNEERYAQALVRGKIKYSQWGKKKVIDYLKQKGISEYCIKKGLKEIDDAEYYQIMLDLVAKKLYSLAKEENAWIKEQKVLRYMLQKGYEMDLVLDAIKEFKD